MKTLLTIVFCISFFFTTSSQSTYYPLVDTGKTWHVLEGGFGGFMTFTYKLMGDTVIDLVNYKILYRSNEEFPVNWTKYGYLHEDEGRKVNYIPHYSEITILDEPKMVYDFSAGVGDTLLITSFAYNYPNELEVIVSAKDSILVNGEYRNRMFYDCEQFPDNFWIEGIGSNNGLIEPGFYCYIVCPTIELLCVKEGETVIFQHEYFSECYIVGEDENQESENVFVVYPNPTKNQLFVIPPQRFYENLRFILTDLRNETVLDEKLINFDIANVNLDSFKPGVYIYLIVNNQELVQNGKIIVIN